ncbi:unnamed protein product [Ectocarpus sp. 8 AP-2014]
MKCLPFFSIPCIVEGFRLCPRRRRGLTPERRAFVMMPSINLAQVTYSLFLALVLSILP